MGMIWFLKALGDVSVYGIFAFSVAAYFGGSMLLWCVLLQCAAYAFGRCARKPWMTVLATVMVAGSFGLCWGSLADLILLLPCTGYLVRQYARKVPLPELALQRDAFGSIWKLLLGAGVLSLFLSQFAAFLTFGVLSLMSNILLLRTLRHSPQVYLRSGFQLMNLGIVTAVPAGAALLGTGPVWKGFVAGITWGYKEVLLPLVMAILWLPGKGIQWLIEYLRPIFNIEPDVLENTQPMETVEQVTQNNATDLQRAKNLTAILQPLLLTVFAVAALIGVIMLFRMLGKKSPARAEKEISAQTRDITAEGKRPSPAESQPVQAIRKYYRRFLKLYGKEGLPLRKSTTSGEVHESAKSNPRLGSHSGRIRQLYIRARYAGSASKEDAKEMGKLYSAAKKQT